MMPSLQLRKRNSNVYGVAACCALVLGILAAQSGVAEEVRFSIGKQPLAKALNEFALQSDREILFATDIVEEKDAEAVEGWYEPEDALAALLADSGLGFSVTEGHTFLVGNAQENEDQERGDSPAETEEQAPEPPPAVEEEEPLKLKEQVVTGSRMIGGDPTARVYSFTAEDIARRGVSGLEEFFRKLPWSHASLTSQTSNSHNVNTPDGPQSSLFDGNGLGISAINLRGLGWENTLVLKDGRRIAGTAGVEGDFVNLLNVPLSAIERVDIQLDGASAVYGSAAIGGVVNFITKKEYRGLSATYRHESSSTDADATTASITAGYGWGSGNVATVLSRSTTNPITNRKTGWTTLDFRGLFGPEFDRRVYTSGQPGVVCIMQKQVWSPAYAPVFSCGSRWSWKTYYQLPADHSGVGATVDDFQTFGAGFVPGRGLVEEPSAVPLDELPPQNGIDGHTNSVNVSLEQQITEDLRLFADVSWSINESYQEYDRRILGPFLVPASNAYNPFGVPVLVDYAAVYEGENGLMPAQHDWSENEMRTVVLGVEWDIGDNHQLSLDLNRSKSWRETRGFRAFGSRGYGDPSAEAFYAALSSPDPEVALNVFGNGTAQGSFFEEFLTDNIIPYSGVTETREYVLFLRGQLFSIWGGPVSYSLGGAYAQNIIYSRGANLDYTYVPLEGGSESLRGSHGRVGVARPSRDTGSYFAELAFPLIGPDNAVPGVHSLFLTLQGNYATTESQGAAGGGLSWRYPPARQWYWDPFEEDFAFVLSDVVVGEVDPSAIETITDGQFSPRVGIQYMPTANATWRVAWRRSFRAPDWSDQFSTREAYPPGPFYGPTPWGTVIIDPFDPDGPTEITRDLGVVARTVNFTPDLEPEYSDSWSVGIDWAPQWVPGLRWSADWSKADYTNRITSSNRWRWDNPDWVLGSDQVAVRNERGDLLEFHVRNINIAAYYNEQITTELEYLIDTRWGSFRPGLSYTRWLEHYQQAAEYSPRETSLGAQDGMDEYRWTGSLSWEWNRWTVDVFAYYTPAYVNEEAGFCAFEFVGLPGGRCTKPYVYIMLEVPSLTTVDLAVTYRMDNGLRIRFGGTNILDRAAPPTLSQSNSGHRGSRNSYNQPYDPTRWDARGQVLFLELNWEM